MRKCLYLYYFVNMNFPVFAYLKHNLYQTKFRFVKVLAIQYFNFFHTYYHLYLFWQMGWVKVFAA